MRTKLSLLLAALICATAVWAADYNVGTDGELRAAIANNNANITVTADIDLSNGTLKGGWGGNVNARSGSFEGFAWDDTEEVVGE